MTSQINYNSIDATYPVAGKDNSSQGFRDNFTIIKNNFEVAYNEISGLQLTGVQTGSYNNLGGNTTIANAIFNGSRLVTYDLGSLSGSQALNYNAASYQKITLSGSLTISAINNWPSDLEQTSMKLEIVVPNTGYTLTWPSSVTLNYATLANINTKTITFTQIGTYIFELSSSDGGSNISVQDLIRNRSVIQGNLSLQTVVSNATVNGITLTVENVGGVAIGNITASNFVGNIINLAGNSASFGSNVTAGNLIANTGIYGTLYTAIQSNITQVGTLTGLEVSGNANVGNLTVSGITDMCGGTQYGVQYANVSNGSSQTIWSNVGVTIINFTANPIASATLTMPTSPVNGQSIKIVFGSNVCTSLSHTVDGGSGQTLLAGLTTANAYSGGTWTYYASTSTWYKG